MKKNETNDRKNKTISVDFETSDMLILSANFGMIKVRMMAQDGYKDYTLKKTKKGNLILN